VVAQALMEVARSARVKVDVRVRLQFPGKLIPGSSRSERSPWHIINPEEVPTVADVVRDIRSRWRVHGDFSVYVQDSMVRWSMPSTFFRDDDVVELRMTTLAAPGDRGRILCSGCECNDPAEFSTWQWTRFCQGRTARCSRCVREADIIVPSKTPVSNAGNRERKKQRSAGTVNKRAEVREKVQQDVDQQEDKELKQVLAKQELAEIVQQKLARAKEEAQQEVAEAQQKLSVDTSGTLSGCKTGGLLFKAGRRPWHEIKFRGTSAMLNGGHNIRAAPSLTAPKMGKLSLESVVSCTQRTTTSEGVWLQLDTASIERYCSNPMGRGHTSGWSTVVPGESTAWVLQKTGQKTGQNPGRTSWQTVFLAAIPAED